MATFSLFDLKSQWSLSIERFPLLDYFPIEGNFPLLDLNPTLLEKVINKFTMASYLPLQQTCRDMNEFIRSSHNISVSVGHPPSDLQFYEGRLRCVSRYLRHYLDMEALYGTRLNHFVLPVDSEGFDAICGYLKKYSITCQSVHIYGTMNMWAKEQCVVLLNILKPEEVDQYYYIRFNEDNNQVSNAIEAIFQVKTLKSVKLRGWNPDAVAPRLLSSFQQVEVYVSDGITDNTQAYYSLLRILCTQQFPNLQSFKYGGGWAGGIYSFKADIENTLRGLDVTMKIGELHDVVMNIKELDDDVAMKIAELDLEIDGMLTYVYASIEMPEGVSPRHRIYCDIYNYEEEGISRNNKNTYSLSMTMIEETPAVSNPLQGTSASPTVVRPSPSSFISPSNPFSSSVPLSLPPSSSFPLCQSHPLPQFPYSSFTPYPPNPFFQFSPFSPYSRFPPPAVSNPLQGASASPTVVRPSPSSFISPSNPFSSSVPLSLPPSSSFPLYQSNPLPQYPYSSFTPYPPNPFFQYSPFSPYSRFPLYPPSSFYSSNTLFPPPFSSFPLNPSGPSPLPPPSRLFPSPSNPEGRMSPLNENK